jgi:predicted ABC-type ATPase
MSLMAFAELDRRPVLGAIAGPNRAGKTTFFHASLAAAGLRFVNADVLADELAVEPYEAARLAGAVTIDPSESVGSTIRFARTDGSSRQRTTG